MNKLIDYLEGIDFLVKNGEYIEEVLLMDLTVYVYCEGYIREDYYMEGVTYEDLEEFISSHDEEEDVNRIVVYDIFEREVCVIEYERYIRGRRI